jgi:hypothetical protein
VQDAIVSLIRSVDGLCYLSAKPSRSFQCYRSTLGWRWRKILRNREVQGFIRPLIALSHLARRRASKLAKLISFCAKTHARRYTSVASFAMMCALWPYNFTGTSKRSAEVTGWRTRASARLDPARGGQYAQGVRAGYVPVSQWCGTCNVVSRRDLLRLPISSRAASCAWRGFQRASSHGDGMLLGCPPSSNATQDVIVHPREMTASNINNFRGRSSCWG